MRSLRLVGYVALLGACFAGATAVDGWIEALGVGSLALALLVVWAWWWVVDDAREHVARERGDLEQLRVELLAEVEQLSAKRSGVVLGLGPVIWLSTREVGQLLRLLGARPQRSRSAVLDGQLMFQLLLFERERARLYVIEARLGGMATDDLEVWPLRCSRHQLELVRELAPELAQREERA